jgi:hypothetical protein
MYRKEYVVDVRLGDEDRVILRYRPKEDCELVVAHDQQSGAYLMLWHSDPPSSWYELQFRGNLDLTLKQFATMVCSFEDDIFGLDLEQESSDEVAARTRW